MLLSTLYCAIIVLYMGVTGLGESVKLVDSLKESDTKAECVYLPGYSLGGRGRELQCCNTTEKKFRKGWAKGTESLTRYIASLQAWNCQQFEEQCQDRTFAFNGFTSLVYDYFCNKTAFVENCFPRIEEILAQVRGDISWVSTEGSGQKNSSSRFEQWNAVADELQLHELSLQTLIDPCVQLAFYNAEKHKQNYTEVVHVHIPACELIWCGFGSNTVKNASVSAWTCMSQG